MKKTLLPLLFCVCALAGCAPLTPPPAGETIIHNRVYSVPPDGRPLRLDIYSPSGRGPFPLVMWIHGGGWKYGNKGWMLYLRKLTQRGFAVASVEYRLSNRAKYPAQLNDCRDALAWLWKNGASYRLDRRNTFLAGASAGGHLAAMLGLEEGHARIDAVCAMYPATDLTGFPNQDALRGYLPELLGGSVNQKRALAESGSPVRHVDRSAPPFLIFHGDKDLLVPIRQSEELDAKLHRAGVESHLVVLPGMPHGFALTDAQLDSVARFFRAHLREKL